MKKSIFFILICILLYPKLSVAQPKNNNYNSIASKIIKNKNGDLFVLGTTKNKNNTSDDIVIIKIKKNESIEIKTIGKELQDRAYSVCFSSNNNLLITGESWRTFNYWGRENVFFLELKQNLKEKKGIAYYFPSRDCGLAIKELSDKNIIILGYSRSFNDEANQINDIFVLKISPDGNIIWHKVYNSAGNDYGTDFLELQNGNILILGELGGFYNTNQADYRYNHDAEIVFLEIDTDGNEVRRELWGGNGHDFAKKIIRSPDNDGYYIIGSTQSYGAGSFDILLLKIDNNYNEIWHKTFGDKEVDYGNSFDLSFDEKYFYIAATTTNEKKNSQLSVLLVDTDGNLIDRENLSVNNNSFAKDILSLDNENCIVLGDMENELNKSNILICRYSLDKGIKLFYYNSKNVKVYPNPVGQGNRLTFEIMPDPTFETSEYYFNIFDINGKQLVNKQKTSSKFTVNTSDFEKGIYIYQIIFLDNIKYTGKFIIN